MLFWYISNKKYFEPKKHLFQGGKSVSLYNRMIEFWVHQQCLFFASWNVCQQETINISWQSFSIVTDIIRATYIYVTKTSKWPENTRRQAGWVNMQVPEYWNSRRRLALLKCWCKKVCCSHFWWRRLSAVEGY